MEQWRYFDLEDAGGGSNPPITPELIAAYVASAVKNELNRQGFNAFKRTRDLTVETPVGNIPFTHQYAVIESGVSKQRLDSIIKAARNKLLENDQFSASQVAYIKQLFNTAKVSGKSVSMRETARGFIERVPFLYAKKVVSSSEEDPAISVGASFKPSGPVVGPLQPDPTNQPPEIFGEAEGGFEPTSFAPAFEADPGTVDNSDAPPDRNLLGWVTLLAGIATIYGVLR